MFIYLLALSLFNNRISRSLRGVLGVRRVPSTPPGAKAIDTPWYAPDLVVHTRAKPQMRLSVFSLSPLALHSFRRPIIPPAWWMQITDGWSDDAVSAF